MTYRDGRWKSMFHRTRPKEWALFDLEDDPNEEVDRQGDEPEIVERHLRRIRDLNASFATDPESGDAMTDEDRARLRALGYLSPEEDQRE